MTGYGDSLEPLESTRPLIAYVDFKSPYAYLAIEPTVRMARELGVAVDWRPFVLDIPSYLGSARLDASGNVAEQSRSAEQWSGVKYAYFDCRRYASLRGLTVRGTVKIWDTNLAAVGMLWARRQGDEVLERYLHAVYAPFWIRELDVEDAAVIRHVLADAGADVVGFEDYAAGPGTLENEALQRAAFDAGIFGVPTFIVNGQSYFGREHLPRIRWHLSGERGPAPDIAYSVPADAPVAPARALEVCVDVADPWSYLALAPTRALAAELGLPLRWQPKVGAPARPLPDSNDRGARHRRLRAEYLAGDIARYAPHALPHLERAAHGRLAASAMLWLERVAPERVGQFVDRAFEQHWRHGLDIDRRETIDALLQELGFDANGFARYLNAEGDVELAASERELAARGVIGAPTYLLDGEPFLGRQHLPLIRARLARAVGG